MKSTRSAPYVAHTLCATIIVTTLTGTQTLLEINDASENRQQKLGFQRTLSVNPSDGKNDGVANLPFARGAIFNCLDDYLAHLRSNGAIDLPWWREISPGVYERVARMTGAARETATRADLMQRFGFTR